LKINRLILTFQNVHALLAAEKCLRQKCAAKNISIDLRATSTPDSINETNSVCSMALEILSLDKKDLVLQFLSEEEKNPLGIHQIDY